MKWRVSFPWAGGQASRVLPLPLTVSPSVLPAHVPCRLLRPSPGEQKGSLDSFSFQSCVGGWKSHPYVLSSQDHELFWGAARGRGGCLCDLISRALRSVARSLGSLQVAGASRAVLWGQAQLPQHHPLLVSHCEGVRPSGWVFLPRAVPAGGPVGVHASDNVGFCRRLVCLLALLRAL